MGVSGGLTAGIRKKKRKAEGDSIHTHEGESAGGSVIREFGSASGPPPPLIKKKIRTEVERVMREMGVINKFEEEGGTGAVTESLHAIRYELHRMQSELLRRQVLDPRHYTVTSIDSHVHAQQGLTVPGLNAFDPTRNKNKKRAEQQALSTPECVCEKYVEVCMGHIKVMVKLYICLLLDFAEECLWGEIHSSLHDAYAFKLLDEYKPLPANTDMQSSIRLTSVYYSKLLVHHITDHTFTELIHSNAAMRPRMVQKILEHLENIAKQNPLPKSSTITHINDFVIPQFDRVLFMNRFTEDNVLVDMCIARSDKCDGVYIHVTPIAGLFHIHKLGIGSIVIQLLDTELEVLLINQHSLYKQATYNWQSMCMVAQWLASKLRIRKVPAAVYASAQTHTKGGLLALKNSVHIPSDALGIVGKCLLFRRSFTTPNFLNHIYTHASLTIHRIIYSYLHNISHTDDDHTVKEDAVSVTSQITYTPRKGLEDSVEIGGNRLLDDGDGDSEADGEVAENGINPNTLLMLEVTLNRKVTVSSLLLDHWRSRNIPKIVGVEVMADCEQDLDTLNIAITVIIPSKKAYKKLIADNKGDDLADLEEYSEDEYDNGDGGGSGAGAAGSITISMRLVLTRVELLVFGHTPYIEQKTVSMTKSTNVEDVHNHPESLLWNVLNRLKVKFQVC
ncbi:hypothetical protein EON65_27600 [archaeon]|nr:MAG: hypothetical protein EON65_27600 [archaeon]